MADRLELACAKQIHRMPSSLDLHIDTSADTYPEARAISGTLSFGFGVLRMRTAHCTRVVGGSSSGTTVSSSTVGCALSSAVAVSRERFGGGSANSGHRQHQNRGRRKCGVIYVLTRASARRVANASRFQEIGSRRSRCRRRQAAHRRCKYTPSARSHLRRCADRNRILTQIERPAITMTCSGLVTYARDRRRRGRYHIPLCPRATYPPRGGGTSPPSHKSAVCQRAPVGPSHRLEICWVSVETGLTGGIRLLRNVGSGRTSSAMSVGLGGKPFNDPTSDGILQRRMHYVQEVFWSLLLHDKARQYYLRSG